MKISLIIPVKNEENTIKDLLNSIWSQPKHPDEIVITDGGSSDNTIELINNYKKNEIPIELICVDEALPGRGRNLAISKSKYDTIAMTDAGVILGKDWLENITRPFIEDENVEVVYGIVKPFSKTLFEKCVSIVYFSAGKKFGKTRIRYPTLVSIAVKKYVWEKIGGFREDLRATEDLIFFNNINELEFKAKIVPAAISFWRPRSSFKETFLLSYKYAVCDADSIYEGKQYEKYFLIRYIKKYIFYLMGLLLLFMSVTEPVYIYLLIFGFIVNSFLTCKKHWNEFLRLISKKPHAYFIIALIILTIDIGSLSGFLVGILKKKLISRS